MMLESCMPLLGPLQMLRWAKTQKSQRYLANSVVMRICWALLGFQKA